MKRKKKMSRKELIDLWEQKGEQKGQSVEMEKALEWFRAVPYQLKYQLKYQEMAEERAGKEEKCQTR